MVKKIIISMFSIFFLAQTISYAETIVLKSGKTVEGNLIEKTDKYIKIDFQGIPLTYFFDEVQSINGEIVSRNEVGAVTLADHIKDFDVTSQQAWENDLKKGFISEEAYNFAQKGLQYFKEKKYIEAAEVFEKFIKVYPRFMQGYLSLAVSYNFLGEHRKAIMAYEKGVRFLPEYAWFFYTSICGEYNYLGELDNSIKSCQKAVEFNPDNPLPYSILGATYYLKGDKEKAKSNHNVGLEKAKRINDQEAVKQIESALRKVSE